MFYNRFRFGRNGIRNRRRPIALGSISVVEALESRQLLTNPVVVISPGPGVPSDIRIVDGTGTLVDTVQVYGPNFLGGARVATADVNNDGTADIITGAGTGGGPHVKVLDGTNPRNELHGFFAFDTVFTGGVFVAAADFNGDNRADILVGADTGGGPHVKVFDGANLSLLFSFFAFDGSFTGGVRVAAGLIDEDNIPDIVASAGPGGGPHVRVFSGDPAQGLVPAEIDDPLGSFFAYNANFTGGVFVATGDVLGDTLGKDDIITGPGAGGGPHVRVWNGLNSFTPHNASQAEFLFEFFVEPPEGSGPITTGLRVSAVDANNDGTEDVVVATDQNVFIYPVIVSQDGGGSSDLSERRAQVQSVGEEAFGFSIVIVTQPTETAADPGLMPFIAGIPPTENPSTSSTLLAELESISSTSQSTEEPPALLPGFLDPLLVDDAFANEELLGNLLTA